jgi:hypothetical protein
MGFDVDILELKRIDQYFGKNRRLRLQKKKKIQNAMTQSYKSFRSLFEHQT